MSNADESRNHVPQSRAIERYIRTIIHMRMRDVSRRSLQDRIADVITDFSGRVTFIYIHVFWFAAWILINTGWFGIQPFDPFPYGLLTMIVSLEAIFLSTFVLISQNRMTEHAEHRADLDLHIDLLTEYEMTRVLQMLHAIEDKLGIESSQNEEQAALEQYTDPESVLDEIEEMQARASQRGKKPKQNSPGISSDSEQ